MIVKRVTQPDESMVTWTRTPENLITYTTDKRGRLVRRVRRRPHSETKGGLMELKRRLLTMYLPMRVGTFAALSEVVEAEFPGATLDYSEGPETCHVLVTETVADDDSRGRVRRRPHPEVCVSLYYDRAGQPIDQKAWIAALESDERVVAADEIGESWISTVYLGLDHGYGDGPPLIFETMVFGGPLDQEQWRYSTETAALAGHQHAVDLVRRGPS